MRGQHAREECIQLSRRQDGLRVAWPFALTSAVLPPFFAGRKKRLAPLGSAGYERTFYGSRLGVPDGQKGLGNARHPTHGARSTSSGSTVLYALGCGAGVVCPWRVLEFHAEHDEFAGRYDALQRLGSGLNVVFVERRPRGRPAWSVVVLSASGPTPR